MAEGRGIVGGEGMGSGGISNVGVLDLTGMKSTEELAGIESISQVGVVLVPESLMSGLLGVPMEKVGATIAVPTGENVKLVTGQMKTTVRRWRCPPEPFATASRWRANAWPNCCGLRKTSERKDEHDRP
jgi:hypothetical protein